MSAPTELEGRDSVQREVAECVEMAEGITAWLDRAERQLAEIEQMLAETLRLMRESRS